MRAPTRSSFLRTCAPAGLLAVPPAPAGCEGGRGGVVEQDDGVQDEATSDEYEADTENVYDE